LANGLPNRSVCQSVLIIKWSVMGKESGARSLHTYMPALPCVGSGCVGWTVASMLNPVAPSPVAPSPEAPSPVAPSQSGVGLAFAGRWPKEATCETCGKIVKGKQSLRLHMLNHTKEQPHVCEKCGRAFSRKSALVRHLRVHEGVRPHVCLICGSTHATTGNLKDHMATHTGEKSFICETCGKPFSQWSSLNKHQTSVHRGE
jgi:uncharacterized Zn-finger protein